MKMLTRREHISRRPPFDLEAVKNYLRVDFDDDDFKISNICHAAAREIEQLAQVALLRQTIIVTLTDLTHFGDVRFPIGPIMRRYPVTVQLNGQPFTDFEIVQDFRPILRWTAPTRDMHRAMVDIEYTAGFGWRASAIPADLSEAIMSQASIYFDGLDSLGGKVDFGKSPHFARIAAHYRGVSA